ncbi:MAG: hypothetical protein ACPGID_04485 [Rubricella sp.]
MAYTSLKAALAACGCVALSACGASEGGSGGSVIAGDLLLTAVQSESGGVGTLNFSVQNVTDATNVTIEAVSGLSTAYEELDLTTISYTTEDGDFRGYAVSGTPNTTLPNAGALVAPTASYEGDTVLSAFDLSGGAPVEILMRGDSLTEVDFQANLVDVTLDNFTSTDTAGGAVANPFTILEFLDLGIDENSASFDGQGGLSTGGANADAFVNGGDGSTVEGVTSGRFYGTDATGYPAEVGMSFALTGDAGAIIGVMGGDLVIVP